MKRVGKNRFAFTLLKSSSKFIKIKDFIEDNFDVKKAINEDKDLILICS